MVFSNIIYVRDIWHMHMHREPYLIPTAGSHLTRSNKQVKHTYGGTGEYEKVFTFYAVTAWRNKGLHFVYICLTHY